MINFKNDSLSAEEAFWTMYYFLEEHYTLSDGTFNVSDILSASEPVTNNDGKKMPADSGMISFWNKAIEKFRQEGLPPTKKLNR